MANLDQYRTDIENVIKEYSQYKPSYGEVEVQIIFESGTRSLSTSQCWLAWL